MVSPTSPFEELSVEDYKTRFYDNGNGHFLLDVRTEDEFAEARIPGAINIPLDELQGRADEVEDAAGGNPVVIVCRTGQRSMMGAQILRYAGVDDLIFYNLSTGTVGWAQHDWPLERG